MTVHTCCQVNLAQLRLFRNLHSSYYKQEKKKESTNPLSLSSIETQTLPYVKQRVSGNLLYEAGNSNPVLCDNLEGWDGVRGGRGGQEGGDIYIFMDDSC